MTAVAATHGAGILLTCDGCGTVTVVDGCGRYAAGFVYVAVAGIGWTGSPYARGPHRCSDCDSRHPHLPLPGTRSVSRDGVRSTVSLAVTTPGALVRVTGDIDADVVPALRSRLDDAVALQPFVIMDLAAAGTIVSEGLSTLVRARNAARRHGGELLLAAPSRFVQTVLWSMRLHTVFCMFDTVPQAVAAALVHRESVLDQGVNADAPLARC